MIVISLVNLKGGTLKTTTSGYILSVFHESGMRVIGIDADGENENLGDWKEDADLPFPVITYAPEDVAAKLPGVVDESRYDVMVIDTPPMKAQRGTVKSVMQYSTHVVLCLAPTPMDFTRLAPVKEMFEEAAPHNVNGRPPAFVALLVKCKASASSPKVYRKQITDAGVPVLTTQIPDRERWAQAYGSPIKNASATAFGDLALELLDLD